MSDEIRDHGKVVTAKTGTPDKDIIDKITGADSLPGPGLELGRPPARPPFDPHAEAEAEQSASFIAPVIATLVFVGLDVEDGQRFEDRLRAVIAYAEGKDLFNLTASVGEISDELYDAIIENG